MVLLHIYAWREKNELAKFLLSQIIYTFKKQMCQFKHQVNKSLKQLIWDYLSKSSKGKAILFEAWMFLKECLPNKKQQDYPISHNPP